MTIVLSRMKLMSKAFQKYCRIHINLAINIRRPISVHDCEPNIQIVNACKAASDWLIGST